MKIPTEEQIRRRAYEIYLKYGEPGRDMQNWLEAEQELQQVQEDRGNGSHQLGAESDQTERKWEKSRRGQFGQKSGISERVLIVEIGIVSE